VADALWRLLKVLNSTKVVAYYQVLTKVSAWYQLSKTLRLSSQSQAPTTPAQNTRDLLCLCVSVRVLLAAVLLSVAHAKSHRSRIILLPSLAVCCLPLPILLSPSDDFAA